MTAWDSQVRGEFSVSDSPFFSSVLAPYLLLTHSQELANEGKAYLSLVNCVDYIVWGLCTGV